MYLIYLNELFHEIFFCFEKKTVHFVWALAVFRSFVDYLYVKLNVNVILLLENQLRISADNPLVVSSRAEFLL
jgi:hypothetical protein